MGATAVEAMATVDTVGREGGGGGWGERGRGTKQLPCTYPNAVAGGWRRHKPVVRRGGLSACARPRKATRRCMALWGAAGGRRWGVCDP